ncbi:hypothetical protein [Lentzea sp. NEAU-D7]|uniref:hypothetical protein n=1 Tax=Lentzea sp. NEAU-D7 TaxID=2994667 RepID=UPI00224ABE23|nr:hypothetical protein [Lentzea sp. NEAU-D7]MCX2949085.1 hypothetical protein [Lentzea sp. NEAU-D7]
MRKAAAIVAFFLALAGPGTASADVSPACNGNWDSHVWAKVQRDSCGSYIGTVKLTNIHTIGFTGHWDIVVNGSKVRAEPTSGDAWLGAGVTRTINVEWFASTAHDLCAVLWERLATGGYSQRGVPCVPID